MLVLGAVMVLPGTGGVLLYWKAVGPARCLTVVSMQARAANGSARLPHPNVSQLCGGLNL